MENERRDAAVIDAQGGKRTNRSHKRTQRNTTTFSLSYLCDIFCVACFSKSPSFPAIAQCWQSEAPVCRGGSESSRRCRFFGEGCGNSDVGLGETVDDSSAERVERVAMDVGGGRRERMEKE
jgi:hypothetical protein